MHLQRDILQLQIIYVKIQNKFQKISEDKGLNRKGIFAAFPILIILVLLSTGMLLFCWFDQQKDIVNISHESGIYTEPFLLEINTMRPATIYYTTDGSEPDCNDKSVMIYKNPIEIGREAKIYSFQFKCVYRGDEESQIYKRDFIIEEQGNQRYDVTYIVSVTGDEESLWGYESGIFTRGRQFDEYMEANPNVNNLGTIIPANYYNDVELPVHVSVFLNNGQEIISKNCGIQIYGNWTRAKNQKSFRLYARDTYDGNNVFAYTFLPKLKSQKTKTVIDEYQRLSFHNSGNDNGYGFVRTALIGRLADQFGFDNVLMSESAVVYINGRYQGFYWLQNTFDDKYFKEKYGNYSGEMVVCEGELDQMVEKEDSSSGEQLFINEYNTFCKWIENVDVYDEENWEYIKKTIDVSNFAQYMAIEYYIGNIDWPNNNVKAYRYVSEENYVEDTVFDGRYRYLLFDTDYGLGLIFQDIYGYNENERRLSQLCDKSGSASLFACMMQREEFRDLFVNAVLVLQQDAFSAENVQKILADMNEKKDSEIQYMFDETDLLKNSLWENDDNSFVNVKKEYEEILTYVYGRPAVVMEEMASVLGCGKLIKLSAQAEGGMLKIDDIKTGERFEGYCYENVSMTISAELPADKNVIGYYVNEYYIEGEVLELEPSLWSPDGDDLMIEAVIEESPTKELSILFFDKDGANDYIALGNTGNVEINLSDYCLSDSLDASKGRLPDKWLQPGEVYYVYGKKYSGNMDNGIRMSFSWNDEEEIILSNNEDGIIFRIL